MPEVIHRLPVLDGRVDPLPPHLVPYATDAVREASERFYESLVSLRTAQHLVTERVADVEAAVACDEAAARVAVIAGKQTPAAVTPKAVEAQDRARRAADAHAQIAREEQKHYINALQVDSDEVRGTVVARQNEIRQALAKIDLQAAAGLQELWTLDELLRALDPAVLANQRRPEFRPVQRRRRPFDASAAPLAGLRAAIAAPVAGNTFITPDAA